MRPPELPRFAAILVMAGAGMRLGADRPKAFVELAGRPLWRHSADVLAALPGCVALVFVVPAEHEEQVLREARARYPDVRVVVGGARRQDSVRAGLAVVPIEAELVAVHDAARPLLTRKTALAVLAEAARSGAALAAIPVRDTLKRVDESGVVRGTVDRSGLWRAETPQAFRTGLLREAHERAFREGVDTTDDAALLERLGHPVTVVGSEVMNLKVTEPPDLLLAEAWVTRQEEPTMSDETRVGLGFDVHRLVRGIPLMLGGLEVESQMGLEGHSDGDVLLHAVTDAILGACGQGDIGDFFPTNDPKWKGKPSQLFVREALERADRAGFELVNVDCVLVAETPYLGAWKEGIRSNLAGILDLDLEDVCVKAKTYEGLGPIGQGKAIEAHAVVLMREYDEQAGSEDEEE